MTGLPRTRSVRLSSAALALLLAPAAVFGQPTPPGPPGAPPPLGAPPESEVFPKNDDMALQIRQTAPDYIKVQDWATAARVLQGVIDQSGDFLLKTEVKGPDGKTTVRYVSGRAEAERMLLTLPKPGLTAYRIKFGGAATVMLGQAGASPSLLEEVARRYFLTDAGAEALTRLGVYELDRGRSEEAADRFRRLLLRPDADELPPLTLFQAALAFHGVNDSVREDQAVQLLSRRLGAAGLTVGGRPLNMAALRAEIARWPTASALSGEWPVFRGDLRRTGRSEGDFPLLEARNRVALPAYEDATKALAPSDQVPAVAGPSLPGFVPLAVGGKLVYRGPDGLHALDPESGKELWRCPTPLSLASLLQDDNQRAQLLSQWLPKYRGLPHLLDENATLGTLSSDDKRVYFIEDVPVPPHPNDLQMLLQPGAAGRPWFSSLEPYLYHNRLRAVDLTTGEPRWEVGGWEKSPNPPPLDFADVFFLGPPLPVGRRLFVLGEQTLEDLKKKKNKDVILFCLEPETGRLLWSQDLAASQESLGMDPARRMQPAQLAYADGVLVCPTNAGAVVAVDPLTRNLLWAHAYHDQVNSPPNPNGVPTFMPDQYEAAWKGCAPIIVGDRVLLTAPDNDSVLCLNLKDGTEVWQATRTNEDLYVAGVFGDKGAEVIVVVGASSCRALRLSDKTEVWSVPTGEPSGLGATAGKYYLIPLKNGNIFALDTSKPSASTVIEGKPDDPPGNLVIHGGDLWSQSATAVVAYPEMGKGLERVEAQVAKNPNDPVARIERGRLFYSKGEPAKAVEDWLFALDHDPPADLAAQTRDRLYNALTQLLRDDFAAYEKYMGPYEKLCRRAAPAGAAPEQAKAYQAEQRRRLLNLLVILAHGREAQGRLDQALQAYRDLDDAAGPNERMTSPDDPALQIRVDLWVQGRVADLVKGAAPEKQKSLKERIDQDWQAAKSAGDPAALSRFIALYGAVPGPLGAAGREARLTLAERWMEDRDLRHALDAELQLLYLRGQADAPETAARAQYDLARLMTRHGLLADAVAAYRELARDFPNVPVHDGKTGAALFDDLAVDKRFVAYLDDPLAARPAGKVRVVEQQQANAQKVSETPCDPADGVAPPCCRNLRFTVDVQTFTLQASSTDGSSDPWSVPLPVPVPYLRQWISEGNGFPVAYQADGHFMVVSLGPLIVGVDRIERRARWVRSILPADLPAGVQVAGISSGGNDGSIWAQLSDGRPNIHLGVLGPVGPNGVLLQTHGGVAALDPSTGELRWLRTDGSSLSGTFGDEGHLYLAESRADGSVYAVRAVRTDDGAADPIPDCVEVYRQRVGNLGRCLLSGNLGDADNPLEFRFYDPQTGKDLWKATFPAHSVFLGSPVPELFAVAAPDGTVTVVDLEAHKELVKLTVDKKHLDQLVRGMLLRDRTQYYLALQGPPAPNTAVVGDPSPNFPTLKATEVNGMIYAFDRATGELRWRTAKPIEAQVLIYDRFEDMPVLLLTAIQQRQLPNAPGNVFQVTCTRSIDKQTGKTLFRKEVANNPNGFFGLEVDARTGTVDLISADTRLHHFIEPAKEPAEHKGG